MAAPNLQLLPSDVENDPRLQPGYQQPTEETTPADPELRARALQLQPPKTDNWSWNREDTAMEGLFGLSMLGDYLQTRDITKAGREMNPIMGPRGNRVSPNLYFPATMALHALAMRALPRPWRHAAQGLSLGFEGGVVGRNLGLGWGFHF